MPVMSDASLRLAAVIQLRSNGASAKTAPVRVVANSGGVIDYPDIGPMVWDFASMTHKARIPLDWSHDDMDSIGYLNKFEVTPEGLVCSGAITPVEGEQSAVVLSKMSAGTPYEASIESWDGELEYVDAGDSVIVNGKAVTGPVFILRNWKLKAVAVCKFGRDSNTGVELLLSEKSRNAAGRKVFSLEMSKKLMGEEMTEDQKPAQAEADATEVAADQTPAAVEVKAVDDQPVVASVAEAVEAEQTEVTPKAVEAEAVVTPQAVEAVETVETEDDQQVADNATKTGEVAVSIAAAVGVPPQVMSVDPRAEFKQFVAAFGAKAADYFAADLSLADATKDYLKFQQSQIDSLTKRLASVDRGAAAPVQFSDSTSRDEAAQKKTLADMITIRRQPK